MVLIAPRDRSVRGGTRCNDHGVGLRLLKKLFRDRRIEDDLRTMLIALGL